METRFERYWNVVSGGWCRMVCWFFGHKLVAEDCDGENGTEEVSCRRCGWGYTARYG